jgi:hypothetical protein
MGVFPEKMEEKEKDENKRANVLIYIKKRESEIKMNPAYIPESRFLKPLHHRIWLETGNATEPAANTQRESAWAMPCWLWVTFCRFISYLPSTYFSTTSYSVYP